MDFFTGLTLAAGIGVCGPQLDTSVHVGSASVEPAAIVQNCRNGIGKVEARAKVVQFSKRVYLSGDFLHLSIFGDGEPRGGDRGTEFLFATINVEW